VTELQTSEISTSACTKGLASSMPQVEILWFIGLWWSCDRFSKM